MTPAARAITTLVTAKTSPEASASVGGLITFSLGARDYCTPLAAVREVVRLEGLSDLPGMAYPLAGVLDLRGASLPVLDLRLGAARLPGARGDVLVVDRTTGQVGIAVDRVRAVVDDLPEADAGEEGVLPAYVVAVLRGPTGPVFHVDLEAMVEAVRQTQPTAQT